MNEYVSIEGIRGIANSLNGRREELKEIFEEELFPLLEECSSLYGINIAGYEQLYSHINNKLLKLSNLLEGGVSHDYEELVANLQGIFNNDFNNKFSELMNTKPRE